MKNKKRIKSKSLIDASGHEFLLDGRIPCLCEASKHNLINNCLICGRIVCEQEGSGPCFTCGTYVLTKEDRDFLTSGSEESLKKLNEMISMGVKIDFFDPKQQEDELKKYQSLKQIAASLSISNKDDQNLNKAIEHKDKLLEFDKKSVARSKVYDDQVDYFQMSSQNFISDENRSEIGKKVNYLIENKFKKTDKICLDLENLSVNDYAEPVIKDLNEEHKKLEELSAIKTDYEYKSSSYFIDNNNTDDKKSKLPPPIYIPSQKGNDSSSSSSNKKKKNKQQQQQQVVDNEKSSKLLSMDNFRLRIQDKELSKIDDPGMCLAVQQPFASLLVIGIKKFEGRTWFSPFKGRLWIYSSQKLPTENDIKEIEQFYRNQGGYRNFPKNYPTGVIVGCVTIEDCLTNEICLKQYPNCECDDPYVFICDYPIAFKNPLPIPKGSGGGEKIYKLDLKIHKACKGLLGF